MKYSTLPTSASGLRLNHIRIGSRFTARNGTVYVVRDAYVVVTQAGAESARIAVERTSAGRSALNVLTVGIFANQVRGAAHEPGAGGRVSWVTAPRRALSDVPRSTISAPLVLGRDRQP